MNVRKRIFATMSATALAIGMLVAVTPTTASAHEGGIHIGLVQYDPVGKDTKSKLNSEWINIHNATKKGYQIKGWKIKDKAGHVFTFPAYTIGAGKNVKVHTGKGKKGGGHVYWGSGSFIWNNTGDKAYLYTPGGRLDDTCSWGNGSGKKNCH